MCLMALFCHSKGTTQKLIAIGLKSLNWGESATVSNGTAFIWVRIKLTFQQQNFRHIAIGIKITRSCLNFLSSAMVITDF